MMALHEILDGPPAVLLYFYSDECGVCKVLKPKVANLLEERFPKVEMIQLRAAEHRALAAQLRMLSLPGILFFMNGQEVFRSNGLISMAALEKQIARPYSVYFE